MSNFAFGTYRISEHNPEHIAALKLAIESGITMIDTSSNYMDGESERAIALALRSFDDDTRDGVEILSKVGYIQGSNMLKHKATPFSEVVEFSEDCFHSISPSFIENQLTQSLQNLELKTLKCYLLHNPEYYLLDAIRRDIASDDRLDEMFRRIYEAFVALEREVQKGRIKSYGISSNSFSKPHHNIEFLPYEDLIVLADRASEAVGNEIHSFTTIELPINLLERDGLLCASWAKENGLRVLVNRALNAQHEELMFRLADYDESRYYHNYLNELLELLDSDKLQSLYTLVEQMDENKHKFGWIGDYDSFLYSQIIPHIQKSIKNLEQQTQEILLNTIDLFLQEYRKMVAYECSKNTRVVLKEILKDTKLSLDAYALKFLSDNDDIDYILVGMRKPSYVEKILSKQM